MNAKSAKRLRAAVRELKLPAVRAYDEKNVRVKVSGRPGFIELAKDVVQPMTPTVRTSTRVLQPKTQRGFYQRIKRDMLRAKRAGVTP